MKSNKLTGLLLLLAFGIFYALTLTPDHDWGGDFAQHLGQARASYEGRLEEWHRLTAYRFYHSDTFIAPMYYPWGLSLLLVPVIIFFGINLYVMKLVMVVFFFLALFVLHQLFKGRWRYSSGLFSLLLMAADTTLFYSKATLMSISLFCSRR